MASKKYTLLAGVFSLFAAGAFAQLPDASYNWKDSAKVSTKKLPQHNEFVNNNYPYPAKPRNQWELGIQAGGSFLLGEIEPRLGFNAGGSLRKAISHTFSVRINYLFSQITGTDFRPRTGDKLFPSSVTVAYPGTNNNNILWIPNFRNRSHNFGGEFVASLNSLSGYRGNPKWDVNVFAGYNLLVADVDMDLYGANGQPYNWLAQATSNPSFFTGKKKDIIKRVKDVLDGKYESNAPVAGGSRVPLGRIDDNHLVRHSVALGFGVSRKLNDKLSLGLTQRYIVPFDDYQDGIDAASSVTNDFFSHTSVVLGINIGNKSKRVAPLWWINGNNYIYNEVNKPSHMKMPPVVLPDADGDGVPDQFDLEPNTPKGAPVDTHGVSKDTDGDGVPDYKDKELLTPQSCFPVNADGVGNCPEPACCKELRDKIANLKVADPAKECNVSLPSVTFKAGSNKLSKDAEAVLAAAAAQVKANPSCNVKVIGYGASDKRSQQLSWDRVNAIIKYLVEKQGIAEDRFIFTYGQDGDANTVDLEGTVENGPNTVPAPHPSLKKSK
jgi:OmpA-OmpF porin, OOP family